MKTCSKCRRDLPLDQFHKAAKGSQGRGAYCKDCQRERTQAWREARKAKGVEVPDFKFCSSCNTNKPSSQFHKQKSGTGGLQNRCKKCQREANDTWRQKNPEQWKTTAKAWEEANKDRRRKQHLKRQYGVTLETYEDLLDQQEGLCAICGHESAKLDLDHDHKTGIIRGLLCNPCNQGLGHFKDDPQRLRAAAKYLEALSSRER